MLTEVLINLQILAAHFSAC